MTQSHLPMFPHLPDSHRWTLWTRQGRCWEFQAVNRPRRLEEIEAALWRDYPGLETLILPPLETPLETWNEMCHRPMDLI